MRGTRGGRLLAPVAVIGLLVGWAAMSAAVIMAPTEQRPFRGELDPPAGCGS